ncbi:MAG: hypothetical protein D6732_13680 [Methanobacteriota archaeon]|nr:MAG: hypothetical protein D6732_13680 [Euryarchaeota archaeon]
MVRHATFMEFNFLYVIPFIKLTPRLINERQLRYLRRSRFDIDTGRAIPVEGEHRETVVRNLRHLEVRNYIGAVLSLYRQGHAIRVLKYKAGIIIVGVYHERKHITENDNIKKLIKTVSRNSRRFFGLYPRANIRGCIMSMKQHPWFAITPDMFFKRNRKWQIPLSFRNAVLDRLSTELKVLFPETVIPDSHAVPLSSFSHSPYLFSSGNKRYGLTDGKTILVHGSKWDVDGWLHQSIGEYRDRMLFLGEFPLNAGSPKHLDFATYHLDFHKMLDECGGDATLFGKFISRISGIEEFQVSFRNFISTIRKERQLFMDPFSKLIESLNDPDAFAGLSEKDRRWIRLGFIQIDDSSILDGNSEFPIEHFGHAWHQICRKRPRQMLFEAYLMLKVAVLYHCRYSLLVIQDPDCSFHLLRSNGLDVIRSEFPHLKIVLCLKESWSYMHRFHQLILGKFQVQKFLPEEEIRDRRIPSVLYLDPNGVEAIRVHVDYFNLKPYENRFDPYLLPNQGNGVKLVEEKQPDSFCDHNSSMADAISENSKKLSKDKILRPQLDSIPADDQSKTNDDNTVGEKIGNDDGEDPSKCLIRSIEVFMERNNLKTVLLPHAGIFLSSRQINDLFGSLPISSFSNRKFANLIPISLSELSKFESEEFQNLSLRKKEVVELQSLAAMYTQGMFGLLFRKLSPKYQRIMIAAGYPADRDQIFEGVLVPLAAERISKIHSLLENCKTNEEVFCIFLKEILSIWFHSEQMRANVDENLVDWMVKVESLSSSDNSRQNLLELNKLMLYYQTIRGGMAFHYLEHKSPSSFIVSVSLLKLKGLWKRIDRVPLAENIDFLLAKLESIAEARG